MSDILYRQNAFVPVEVKPKPMFGLILKERHVCDLPRQPNALALCFSGAVKITPRSVWRCSGCKKTYMWANYNTEEWTETSDLYWLEAGGQIDE